MNKTLFLKEFKSNYKIILIFIGVLTMYSSLIIAMFDPTLGESLRLMEESLGDVFKAFGMGNAGTTLIDFIGNYLYGFIVIVFPMVFIIVMANRLITRYADKGSLAYLLATPNKRVKIALTQAVFFAFSLFVLVGYVTILGVIVSNMLFSNSLDINRFIILNVGLYGLLLFLSSICFLFACLFQDARNSMGMGAGILIASVLIQMISQVGDKFEFLKYFTPLTLFDVSGIIASNFDANVKIMILYGVAILLYGIGIKIFKQRDFSI